MADEYAEHLEQVMEYLANRGIDRQMAETFGLGYVESGNYAGRLSIPYHTPAGVVAMKYRCTNASHGDHKDTVCPKYLYEVGDEPALYNAYALIRADKAVVVEGELKAVVVQSRTDIPTVGYPGTENWKGFFSLCFEGIAEVIVVADEGKPGRDAAERVTRSIGSRARVVYTPAGMDDPDTMIARQGVEAFLSLIK